MPRPSTAQRVLVDNAPTRFICSCTRYCGGAPKTVPSSTYYRHRAFAEAQEDTESARPRRAPYVEDVEDIDEPAHSPRRVTPLPPTWYDDDTPAPPPPRTPSPRREPDHPPPSTPPPPPQEPPPDPPFPARDEEDPEYGRSEDTGAPRTSHIEEVAYAQEFIAAIRAATLEESGLDEDTIHRIRHPEHGKPPLTRDEQLAFRVFLATGNASEQSYRDVRAGIHERMAGTGVPVELPTYEALQKRLAALSGVVAISDDMCPNTCMAYVGPWAERDTCIGCGASRWDPVALESGKKVPMRTFYTFPLGPQLQALWASPDTARLMRYRLDETRKAATRDERPVYRDYCDGSDYVDAFNAGKIKDDDMVVLFSVDGAQLYALKQSDCWLLIWVILDLPPLSRYKKRFVLPGGIIGGPNKPKYHDSFSFRSLHHLSALRRDSIGLRVWDAAQSREFRSDVWLALATADGPGMTYLNGLVGHQGAVGCRLYCDLRGRHKPGAACYYPAMNRPTNTPARDGITHPDYTARFAPAQTPTARYQDNLRAVLAAGTKTAYARMRLATGIAKPSIFEALEGRADLPALFPGDLMHLIALNLTELLLGLFCATFPCDSPDSYESWDWACFAAQDVWEEHGALVEMALPFLPGSFDRPPRNPAEKINSGYKAWEFLTYVYGLLPGFMRPYLAPHYHAHFCKLVAGVRVLMQHEIPSAQLARAHKDLLEFAEEFEEMYYCRRIERLHFVRQSVHALTHLAPQVEQTGPGSLHSQWTIENYIGNITDEIGQDSAPYENLSERAYRRCQVNALYTLYPELAPETPAKRGILALADGYTLLHATEEYEYDVEDDAEAAAITRYMVGVDPDHDRAWVPRVRRWARLRVPTGQIVRTAWKECVSEARGRAPRRARMVKVRSNGVTRFGEVQYFFVYRIENKSRGLAMVKFFDSPDADILAQTHGTVMACNYGDGTSREVIACTDIVSCIAMVPLPMTAEEAALPDALERYGDRYFVVEKIGLQAAQCRGYQEEETAEDNADVTP